VPQAPRVWLSWWLGVVVGQLAFDAMMLGCELQASVHGARRSWKWLVAHVGWPLGLA
jgi:hypothetical protein